MRDSARGRRCHVMTATAMLVGAAACSGGATSPPPPGGGSSLKPIQGPPPGTDLQFPNYLTFDAAGNLWLSVEGSSQAIGYVAEYGAVQLAAGGLVTPPVVLGGFQNPQGLAFD